MIGARSRWYMLLHRGNKERRKIKLRKMKARKKLKMTIMRIRRRKAMKVKSHNKVLYLCIQIRKSYGLKCADMHGGLLKLARFVMLQI